MLLSGRLVSVSDEGSRLLVSWWHTEDELQTVERVKDFAPRGRSDMI